jgi:uncharacterized protein YdhG (YjbR/CyaY superfamily)
MNITIKDIDTYISMQPEIIQPSLEKLRQLIKSVAPEAQEVISYGMPAFKWNGMLVGFAAAKKHIGFYPWNGSTVEHFKDELKSYGTSPGAIRFDNDKPLPLALIKKIVKWRMKENLAKQKK